MEQSLFEIAARRKFRFSSAKGDLTVENLFELPLRSERGVDLNAVAQDLNANLKESGEENFVDAPNPVKGELEQKFELVKLIIKMKQDENSVKLQALQRKEHARKIEDILARKKDEQLSAKSVEELEKELAALVG